MPRQRENDLRVLVLVFLLMCFASAVPVLLPSAPRAYFLSHFRSPEWSKNIGPDYEPSSHICAEDWPRKDAPFLSVDYDSYNWFLAVDSSGWSAIDLVTLHSEVRSSLGHELWQTEMSGLKWWPQVDPRPLLGLQQLGGNCFEWVSSFYTDPTRLGLSLHYGTDPHRKSIPLASVDRVDEVVDGLDIGNIAFHAPQTMVLNKPQDAELVLSLAMTALELREQLQDKLGWTSAEIHVSNRIEARIYGTSNFKVLPISPEVQLVSSTDVARWKWEVTPSEVGDRTLSLEVFAHISIDGVDSPYRVQTIRQRIKVNVTTTQRVATFAQTNWQWLMTAFAIPLFLFFWKGWRERKKKESLNPLSSTPLASRWVQ